MFGNGFGISCLPRLTRTRAEVVTLVVKAFYSFRHTTDSSLTALERPSKLNCEQTALRGAGGEIG